MNFGAKRGAYFKGSSPGKREARRAERERRERYTPTRLRRRKLSGREWALVLIPAFAAVAAAAVVLFTMTRGTGYRFECAAFQYYNGNAARVEAGTELALDRDGKTVLKQSGSSRTVELPFYLESGPSVLLPTDLVYCMPRARDYRQAAAFTELECNENGAITAARDGKTAQPEHGFLYDGGDFYLFLEPVTVAFNGYTMELPALSYVEAVYGGYVMVFNYETRECFTELSDGTGTARPSSGDYVVSLLGDSMTLYDGTKLLLATRASLFDPVV